MSQTKPVEIIDVNKDNVEDAVNYFVETADELNIPNKVIELWNAKEVRELAPTAYGIFNVVYNGKLFSYRYLLKKDI